ncbi:MAG TPA: ATP-binding protein [bacterium]|nr:ATP-binding protein [bacterium]
MGDPTLAQLLNFFRTNPLPEEPTEDYADYTVESLSPCGADDSPTYRMLGYPNGPDHVLFLPPDQIASPDAFLNPDDELLRRVLTGTGGLVYEREGRSAGGETVPMGRGALHLCRSESPAGDTGLYTVSVSDNAVLNNAPGNPAPLRRVPIALTQSEIEAIVHGLRRADGTIFTLDGDHYLVDELQHSQLSLMPDRNELEQIIELIEADGSPAIPPGERREAIVAALNDFIRAEAAQSDILAEQLRWPPALIAGLSVVASIVPSVALMIWMQRRNERLMRELQQGPRINTAELFNDPTGTMRTSDRIVIPESQRRYVEAVRSRFNQGQFAHIVLSGPSGSGKSFTADLIGRLAVNGQLGVEGFAGRPVRFVRIDANDVIRSAGSWQNGAQARFFEVLNELTRDHTGPLIIHLLEADKFAAAGQGPGNQPLNLLKELYTIMEGVNPQYRDVHFILDSTRWQIIREAAPDMLRRAQFMEIIPTTPEDLRSALESGVRSRRTSHADDRIRARFERITFSPDALDAITAMGEYRDGAPPSSHLSMIDTLAEEASQHTTGPLTITREHVLRLVARDRALPIAEVRRELETRLGTEGIRQNPRIQSAILEGFYRAYPEPMRGRVNPMDLAAVADANPASLFDSAPEIVPDTLAATPVPFPPLPPEWRAPNEWREILTNRVNVRIFTDAISETTPMLGEFDSRRFRRNHANIPETESMTVEETLRRFSREDLAMARADFTRLGIDIIRSPERAIYQLYLSALNAELNRGPVRARLNEHQLKILEERGAKFESRMRAAGGLSRSSDAPPPPAGPVAPESPRPPTESIVESAVIRGADARPVDGIDADVVRAQILQRFPRFLSQAAHEALEDGEPLPTGSDAINERFAREVEALTNRIVAEYHSRMETDRADIDRRWEDQAREAGYVIREGVPDSFLREVADAYIAREAARSSSPLRGAASGFRADADRALDTAEFERHMELLRHIGR